MPIPAALPLIGGKPNGLLSRGQGALREQVFSAGAAAGGRYDTGLTPLENVAAAFPGAAGSKSSSKKLRKLSLLRGIQAAEQRGNQEKAEGQELQRKRDRFLSSVASGRAGRLSLLPGTGESAVATRSLIA